MQQTVMNPDFSFLEKVEAAGPFNAALCFQCRKCTNGCPATFAMDLYPDQVIRLAILGQKNGVLRSRTIWVCASCETCTTRCPNGVRIAELMDHFKELAVRESIPSPEPEVLALHQAFLETIKFAGRVFEAGLVPLYTLRSGQISRKIREGSWREDLRMAWKLYKKDRMPLVPKVIKGRAEVRDLLRSS